MVRDLRAGAHTRRRRRSALRRTLVGSSSDNAKRLNLLCAHVHGTPKHSGELMMIGRAAACRLGDASAA